MATFTFDTHRAIQNLKETGLAEAQAEAVVALVSSVFAENVATKADLQQLEKRLEQKMEYEFRLMRSDMQAMDQRTEARFVAMEERTDDKFTAFEQRTDARFTAFEQRTEARFAAMEERTEARFAAMEERTEARFTAMEERAKADRRAMEQRIILKIVAILIPCFGLLFAALRFIP